MTDLVVLIGAGSIGQAIARRVGAGRTVLIADLHPAGARAAAETLADAGFVTEVAGVDVADAESVAALAARASALGDVTHVIHAAGVSPVQATAEQVVAVDLVGTALVLDAFGAIVAPGGSGIVVASQAGHMMPPLSPEQRAALGQTPAGELAALPWLKELPNSGAAYGVAKQANAARVQYQAPVWGDRGATLNSISPGVIITPLAREEMAGPGAEGYRQMLAASAAGRAGTPDEIGEICAFLMGQRFITGSDLLADGGVIAAMAVGRYTLPGM